jgi:hypothetical protein
MDGKKRRRKQVRLLSFTLNSSGHKIWDAAFTPATPAKSKDLEHLRTNTDSHTLYNTQHTRIK